MQLILVGSSADVEAASRVAGEDARLVAMTADASSRLIERGIEFEPIGALAPTDLVSSAERTLVDGTSAITRDFDSFAAERSPLLRWSGPGPLTSQRYDIFIAVTAVATRVLLAEHAIGRTGPERVVVLDSTIDRFFAATPYERQPWLEALEGSPRLSGLALEIESGGTAGQPGMRVGRMSPGLAARAHRLRAAARRRLPGHPKPRSRLPEAIGAELEGMRVLFADRPRYDWAPLASELESNRGRWWNLDSRPVRNERWRAHFADVLGSAGEYLPIDTSLETHQDKGHQAEALESFESWLSERSPSLMLGETDLLPALRRQLAVQVAGAPALAAHTDAVGETAIARSRAQMVCFNHVSTLNMARLAFACRSRGIPAVSFQHGGCYGTHAIAKYELIDPAHVDWVLTYGDGIEPPGSAGFSPAPHIPVGSTRVERMKPRRSRVPLRRRPAFLWIAEITHRNGVLGTHILEDTLRFEIEVECLVRLAKVGSVIYRPFPGQLDESVTAAHLQRLERADVRIDPRTPLEPLIRRADLVINDCNSGTTWNEAMALGVPQIVYCDSGYTPMRVEFGSDLGAALRWCRTADELREAVDEVVSHSSAGGALGSEYDRRRFLERYVVHRSDGAAVERLATAVRGIVGGPAVPDGASAG